MEWSSQDCGVKNSLPSYQWKYCCCYTYHRSLDVNDCAPGSTFICVPEGLEWHRAFQQISSSQLYMCIYKIYLGMGDGFCGGASSGYLLLVENLAVFSSGFLWDLPRFSSQPFLLTQEWDLFMLKQIYCSVTISGCSQSHDPVALDHCWKL